ncbi:hypothetical protein RvY_01097 [Ramazzottius varieornatus]|uniref:Uncharacterized protein n=1 Tax=Ramazzottius varieornatus TaxID=947166 RepID=A0A1D1UQF1_RAMVA|nr:hypothetical protein RvY_01097 [Ramazzottius varieornatus]
MALILKVELHFQGIFHLACTVTDHNQRADLFTTSLVVAVDQLKTAVARKPVQSAQTESLRLIPVPKDPALFGTSSFGNAWAHSDRCCNPRIDFSRYLRLQILSRSGLLATVYTTSADHKRNLAIDSKRTSYFQAPQANQKDLPGRNVGFKPREVFDD